MTKSEEYISFIVDQLRSGNVEYVKVSSQFCTRFHKTQRTFASYWKQANEAYRIEAQEREKLKLDSYTTEAVESLKSNILSSLERQAILSRMAQGEHETEQVIATKDGFKKVKVKPSHSDIRAAIAELNKMDGSYAPTKVDAKNENTGTIRVIRE